MRLIDLDQPIFVPIIDESKGGVKYELQMTVGEMFDKFCEGFQPKVVDAVPVEWLRKYTAVGVAPTGDRLTEGNERLVIHRILNEWRKEQEAHGT